MTVSSSSVLLIFIIAAVLLHIGEAYTEVHLNYYQAPSSPQGYIGYGGTVCSLKNRDIPFANISSIDPDLDCQEKKRECHQFVGCFGGNVQCKVKSDYSNPVSCEKVKRICEVSLEGELAYGTCKKVSIPPGDCCYVLKDRVTGLWQKERNSKCPWGCFGVISEPFTQWCKTCTCDKGDSGTGQGGGKSFSDLC
ncbi:hypothetical protein BDF20DRAFT_913563 [Mycotypha africana]|uniref:uncharacterized protein n=1 Tax=Mycotypha africana TaxID=64632 RepID=UPI002300D0A2|nr:uncharacterized protein BDF20DRAFT_913563 [Mycotypha africana]KAI8977206.1 hypothetical protein BDF20DRAFT_913563 [Mycotypha africana]